MNNFEKIKKMDIEELAEFIIATQLKIMVEIQQTLVFCLPLPDEKRVQELIKETRKALESEVEE